MSLTFQELDFRSTPIGDLMLRRRRMPLYGDTDIYEVKLGEEFLMTSLFHEAEDQLAILGLKAIEGDSLDVIVGGLGLGYTAIAALADPRIRSLGIVEYLEGVIEWHRDELVPMGKVLNEDSRCRYIQGDFFALCKNAGQGFDQTQPQKKHDVILLDIDHTPTHVLNPTNQHLYSEAGLRELSSHLKPGGVFAMWADGVADAGFVEQLEVVFQNVKSHTIEFPNALHDGVSTGAVYVAHVKG